MIRDYKTIKRMYEIAGKNLADRIRNFCCRDIELTKRVFYYPNLHLNSTSPYQCCAEGRYKDVERFIGALEQGTTDNFFLESK